MRSKSRRLVALACVICAPAAVAGDPEGLAFPVGSVEVQDLPSVTPDGQAVPVLNLSLPLGAVKPAARPGKRGAAPLKVVAKSADPSLALNEGPVALDLKVPGGKDLTSGAVLNLNLPDGAVKAQATASVGKEDGQTAFWHKDAAEVEANLSGPLGTSLTVAGENHLSLTYRAPESVGSSDQDAHIVHTTSQTGRASLTVPVSPFRVTVGGDSSAAETQEGAPGSNFAQSAVRTANHTAYVTAEWQPLADLHLKGGTAARVTSISWQGDHASTYRTVNPNLTATLTPFKDTTVTAKVEHTVAPYDAAAFANYAKADPVADASSFQPDHAWQIETKVEQKLGPAAVTATYTAARQGTVTEFAEIGGVQAPATASMLTRDNVAVAVSLPLASIGLPHTDLHSEASWQTSRVVDPVTQAVRAASGQPDQKVSLKLSHQLPAQNLSVGLTGEFTGERTSYQVKELSTTAAGGTLGAFVSYKPGAYEVDLNVNGLYGTTTRDDFYRGMRGSSLYSHSTWQDNSGPSLKLSVKRPF